MVTNLEQLAQRADYSLRNTLKCDPHATQDGRDHQPRQVFSGHYVPVKPTPLDQPRYLAHSKDFFHELGFADDLAQAPDFIRFFSGDLSNLPEPLLDSGWACGYALSIYGTEYTQQCPFGTGNGYGDGRAISILEAVIQGQRWEMQLKGAGQTPYCRGADGRAVLRSSVREFLAQEHMHALGVPTSRSLCLYVSATEKVKRPWYSQGSRSLDPDQLVWEPVAITTRVAPSFIRVGQLELFARRARSNAHPHAPEELELLVLHLIEREYSQEIDPQLTTEQKVLQLARLFMERLTSLVANWIRVGYCQGNFNSDNCAAGGFTLDYGPFGFCEVFDPYYQPWTGGGRHFCFFNQPAAAERNFRSLCSALSPLLAEQPELLHELNALQAQFTPTMQQEMQKMWAAKLGLNTFDYELYDELLELMTDTPLDYTLFFRELSKLPDDISALKPRFYTDRQPETQIKARDQRWSKWLEQWRKQVVTSNPERSLEAISEQMQNTNPKYTLREGLLASAYQQASQGDTHLLYELQDVMTQPYAEQSAAIEENYYRLKPLEHFGVGGLSHYSCSS
ncbi:protein adenylyltransferase SelO family protein [Marinospirillum sp.]|uniref:protein adenylyltransferase SelO family protein n=1 Tax=Marinospirillum sp. TaxID=2183934 RepID=UPI003850170C